MTSKIYTEMEDDVELGGFVAEKINTDNRTNFDEILPNNEVRLAIVEMNDKYGEAFRRLA